MPDGLPTPERIWRIYHRTLYSYACPARDSFNETRLTPVSDFRQTLRSFDLIIKPSVPIHRYIDFCANTVHHFDIWEPHDTLLVESHSIVEVRPAPDFQEEAVSLSLTQLAATPLELECYDYLSDSRFVNLDPAIWRMAVDATVDSPNVWSAVLAIMRFVHGWLTYTPASTHVHTTVRDLLKDRRGVCQDYAHMMLALCRTLKIPARYISGYLATESVRATHAWVEVYLPGVGWYQLDPTHNQPIDQNYIKIGAGRDYADVAPVTGHYKGSINRKMEVEVKIEAQ